ncbi:MAG: FlgD immunoglobulin-like domain containing protein [Candidatus Zixiibacteriota bacterium]
MNQNCPNPFNAGTRIEFSLPRSVHVKIDIFDISGRCLITLTDSRMNAGDHSVEWDGTDTDGNPAASGIYFYQLIAEDFHDARKMILLK